MIQSLRIREQYVHKQLNGGSKPIETMTFIAVSEKKNGITLQLNIEIEDKTMLQEFLKTVLQTDNADLAIGSYINISLLQRYQNTK